MAVGPGGVVVGSVSGGCVEGAVYELASEVLESGGQAPGVPAAQLTTYGYSDETAFAVGLTCGGQITLLVERIDHERTPDFGQLLDDVEASRPVAVAQVLAIDAADDASPLEVGARLRVTDLDTSGKPRHQRSRRGRHRRRAGAALGRADRSAPLRPARRASPGHRDRLRRVLRPAAADAGLRRHRLRRRRREDRGVPRLPGHGVRRAPAVRHRAALPGRPRGGRRVAAPLPRAQRGRRSGQRAHGDLRAHARPEVRRSAARGRPAHRRRLRRCHGQPSYPRRASRAAARTRHDRGRAGEAALADRPRHRGAYARGDRRVGCCGDHRLALGRKRAPLQTTAGPIHNDVDREAAPRSPMPAHEIP